MKTTFEPSGDSATISQMCSKTALSMVVAIAVLISNAVRPSSAVGDVIAAVPSASGSTLVSTGLDGTFGWRFGLSNTIQVTHLGTFDHSSNGIPVTPVGLWHDSGALLTVADVHSGSPFAGPALVGPGFSGSFRYQQISTLQLSPGIYRVGSDVNFEGVAWRLGSPGLAGLTYLNNVARPPGATILVFPSVNFANDGVAYFGANFRYVIPQLTTSVPHLGTLDLGTVSQGGTPIIGGELIFESTGHLNSYVALTSANISGAGFSHFTFPGLWHLISNGVTGSGSDRAIHDFQFDPTGLLPGIYTGTVVFNTSLGVRQFNLRAEVIAAIPEPGSCLAMAICVAMTMVLGRSRTE
ncbi:MAG TPA: hypothetical protein PKD54_13515 [Pirellulaceae bacterium]|nr:hypothetical protein [Pirellulaceae bacterium]